MIEKIGIIGFGYVGRSVMHSLQFGVKEVYVWDKYNSSNCNCVDLGDVIEKAEVIFICVPTDGKITGEQDLSHVIDVIEDAKSRFTGETTKFVIKSTVVPGTTRTLNNMYRDSGFQFIFVPEFLTERYYVQDALNPRQIVVGYDSETDIFGLEVAALYQKVYPWVKIRHVSSEMAELGKYAVNAFSAVKVTFSNQLLELCRAMGVDYNGVRDIWVGQGWTTGHHTEVPGHDGKLGFGGKCLPKDTVALFRVAWDKYRVHLDLLDKVLDINNRIRNNE